MNTVDALYPGNIAWSSTNQSESKRNLLPPDTTALPGDVTPLKRNVPLRQRSLGAMPSMARYRSDSVATEPRLSVCSTSGTEYERVVVVGHTYGSSHKIVYYLLEVRSWAMPLEGYVVRRRYNDFCKFHDELANFMPTRRRRSSTTIGLGLSYSSLLCNPLTSKIPETSPLWSPTRTEDGREGNTTDHRRASGGSSEDSNYHIQHEQVEDIQEDQSSRSSAAALLYPPFKPNGGVSSYNSNATLPLDAVRFNLAGRPWLPLMPTGGMLTLFTTRHALIQHRMEQFNHILAAVMSDKSSEVASLLMNFIQEKPGSQAQSYTHLSEFAPIDIPFNVERVARRRAMSIGKRHLRDHTSVSPVACVAKNEREQDG